MPSHNRGPLSQQAFGQLAKGFERSNPAIGSKGPTQSNVLGALGTLGSFAIESSPVGKALGLVNVAGNIAAEKAAAESLGRVPTYSAAILGDTIQSALTNNMSQSSMSIARSQADTNKDGRVSAREAQNYGMNKGLTAYDVGVDMTRPSAGINRSFSARQMDTPDPAPKSFPAYSPANPANLSNKDYGPSYSPTAASTIAAIKGNLGISDAAASTSSGRGIASGDYGLGMGPRGGPVEDIAPSPQDAPTAPSPQDDSSNSPTFICTVVYEKGDMPESVYIHDKLYGKVAHKNLYDGYAVWGKPLAKLMKRNNLVYRIAKPIALSWANQMAHDKSNAVAGKKSITGKLAKYIGEPLCYAIGFIINRSKQWLKLA